MKIQLSSLIFFLLIIYSIVARAQNDDVTLFDKRGKAIAYISTDDDQTIYLFDGEPVAYLIHKGETYHIYGFNGKHLGWYEEGVIHDLRGDGVGFVTGAIRMITETEPLKNMKQEKPYKHRIEEPKMKPVFRKIWSQTPLSMFLKSGLDK